MAFRTLGLMSMIDYYTRIYLTDHDPSDIRFFLQCHTYTLPLLTDRLQLDWQLSIHDALPFWPCLREAIR